MGATTTIQFRRGTAAQWTTANPVLSAGELGWESDTGEFKVGNGASTWTALGYWISDVAAHTHPSSQIADSTATGRSLITAADAAAARTAIGAGTSSLAIGTTGTTAMAGNKTFAFSEITGTIGTSQLPPLAINDLFVVGTQAAMLALTAQRGDMAIRTDTGVTYVLSTDSPGTIADWKEIVAAGAVTSVAGRQGAVVLSKTDVGLSNVDNTADTAKPVSTAQQTALNAKENTIAAGTISQYYRGDKTWATQDKASVGLANVDNTSDINKPVSTAQQAALNGKENTIAAGLISQYYRGDKTWATNDKASVGLANVDNTSDASKPVSTAQQTALNLKANLASPAFTGTPTGITATHVGLGNVDNTSDLAKPISTATQTALNLKAPLASPAFTGTPTGITATHVGLGSVNNTSDLAKPISTATQTALNGKANTSHTHVAADILSIDGGTP
jgi:Major tropism determinant N-terminal domain